MSKTITVNVDVDVDLEDEDIEHLVKEVIDERDSEMIEYIANTLENPLLKQYTLEQVIEHLLEELKHD